MFENLVTMILAILVLAATNLLQLILGALESRKKDRQILMLAKLAAKKQKNRAKASNNSAKPKNVTMKAPTGRGGAYRFPIDDMFVMPPQDKEGRV